MSRRGACCHLTVSIRSHGFGMTVRFGMHRPAERIVNESSDALAVDRLLADRALATASSPPRWRRQHLERALFLLAEDLGDLSVDDPARVLGVVACVHEVLAQEDHSLRSPRHRTKLVLIPHSRTILRASSVLPTRSLLAPVERSP